MYTTILFDLGGVLFTNGTKKFIKYASQKYDLDPEKVNEVMDGEIGSLYRENYISKDEFWRKAIEVLHIEANADELNNIWINGYELIEGTKDIILKFKKNYHVFYLSDNVKERVEKINQRYGFLDWFEGGIFSYEVDVRKPDPKIYTLALEKAGTKPEQTIFIDDKQSALIPAQKLGITTILFEDPSKLETKLFNIGVL